MVVVVDDGVVDVGCFWEGGGGDFGGSGGDFVCYFLFGYD